MEIYDCVWHENGTEKDKNKREYNNCDTMTL